MKVYDALLRDGAEKRARAESVDSLPTTAAIWHLLRKEYGAQLVGATLVAIVDRSGNVTVQTMVFPKEAPEGMA